MNSHSFSFWFAKPSLRLVLFILIFGGKLFSQPYSTYLNKVVVYQNNASNPNNFLLVPDIIGLNKNIGKAVVKVNLNLGPIYKYGDKSNNNDFSTSVVFQISALDGNGIVIPGVFDKSAYTLQIDNNHPEAVFVKDVTKFQIPIPSVNGTSTPNEELKIQKVVISNIVVTNSGSLAPIVQNDVVISLSAIVDYGVDVNNVSPVTIVPIASEYSGGRVINFQWTTTNPYPDYQFQLLRLYNVNPSDTSSQQSIMANIDWSKALTLETESPNTSISLTVAEGKGYYIWRVRPVGTYYPGGYANAQNLNDGGWSSAPSSASSITISSPSSRPYNCIFFLDEPDSLRNWIYGRTFAEGNRISEQVTYATGLQQQKQKQVFLKSQNTTLITQSVYDYTGRPTLSTIPVPVAGNQLATAYRQGFVKDKTGNLYRAVNFDADTNYFQPDSVLQTGTDYRYYSNANTDNTIPNAEGYPFTRILYYNDGQNRVKEQSGVGKTLMIGTVPGMGKTVKTIYGTASYTELVRLFGDETPDNEAVIKTITTDQNGVSSVGYTSRDGKLIATALAFSDPDQTALLPLQNEASVTSFTTNDLITRNLKTDSGFVSSKRLALLDNSLVNLSYNMSCLQFARLCDNVQVDCKFSVQIKIFNVDTQQLIYTSPLTPLSPISCVEDPNIGSGAYKEVIFGSIQLAPGTYVIQKCLKSGSDPVITQSEATDRVNAQIMPISNLISGWLKNIKCAAQLNTFYISLDSLAAAFKSVNTNKYSSSSNILKDPTGNYSLAFNFPQIFKDSVFKYPQSYTVNVISIGGIKVFALINTPCCSIKLPIEWIPTLNCPNTVELVDVNNNGVLDINPNYGNPIPAGQSDPTEIFPDFEGYAMNYLQDCPVLRGQSGDDFKAYFYDSVMVGWPQGTFNLMVYHMLTDTYVCSNTAGDTAIAVSSKGASGAISSTPQQYDDCGNLISAPSQNGIGNCKSTTPCLQYACQDLINCWLQQLNFFKQAACNGLAIDTIGSADVSSSFDDKHQSQTDKPSHNSQFDDNFHMTGIRFLDWLLSKAVSGKMRENQHTDFGSNTSSRGHYNRHLVKDFLDCTGYKFAKITTPITLTLFEPSPLPQDSIPIYKWPYQNSDGTLNADGNNDVLNSQSAYNGSGKYTRPNNSLDVYYVPFSNWIVNFQGSNSTRGLFPFIKNPIYAFKYFEYDEALKLNGNTSYVNLEFNSCYRDYNDCYTYNSNTGLPTAIVPCCGNTSIEIEDTNYCARSYQYPNLANINNPTKGTDTKGNFKYIVNNFCDRGRIVCPYTHEYWSCGQRFTFYQSLRNVNPDPTSDMNFPATQTNSSTCEAVQGNGQGFIDNQGNPTSYVDYQANVLTQQCLSNCGSAQKRSGFESAIRKSLLSNCYVINGCVPGDSVVLDSDIQIMVDSLVAQCQSQCGISTFNCLQTVCRDVTTSPQNIGADYFITSPTLNFGVGGTVADACSVIPGGKSSSCSAINLSYQQYTLWYQASQWDYDISFDCKCINQTKCPQFIVPIDCNSASSSKTATYMQQSQYLINVNNNTIFDPYNIKVNDPAYSPTRKFVINAQ